MIDFRRDVDGDWLTSLCKALMMIMDMFDDAWNFRWMGVDRSGHRHNRHSFINDWLVLQYRLVLRRRRDFKFRHVILMCLVSFGEEGIGLRIESRQVKRIILRYADVIIEVAETVISILPNGSLLLAHHGFVLVNDFLDDFEDVRIEVQV